MAEAAAPERAGGGPLAVITRKVGPLPVWAYAAILVAGYFLYRRMHPATTSSPTSSADATDATGASTYVPPFDAASGVGGGGIGSTGLGDTVNNYYYGDQASGQASGGGTSSVGSGSVGTPGGVGEGVHVPVSFPTSPPVSGGPTSPQSPSAFQVPVSSQIGVGGSRASRLAGLV